MGDNVGSIYNDKVSIRSNEVEHPRKYAQQWSSSVSLSALLLLSVSIIIDVMCVNGNDFHMMNYIQKFLNTLNSFCL